VAIGKSKSTLNARMAFSGVENPSNKKKQRLVTKLYTPPDAFLLDTNQIIH